MAHLLRIKLSRMKGYRKPEGAVTVSRPSRFGNPFVEPNCREAFYRLGLTQEFPSVLLVELYRLWMTGRICHRFIQPPDAADIASLRGKQLACWCPLDQPCHADVLCELANE